VKSRVRRSLGELGAVPPIAAVLLLVVNDHLLKGLFHNAVTGKLSDLAICFLVPLLVASTLGMLVDWPVRRRLWIGAAVGATVFALLEMSDVADGLFQAITRAVGLGPVVLTRDPGDLWALLCVPLAVIHGQRRITPDQQARWTMVTGALALVTGAMALVATSPAVRCGHWSPPVVFQVEAGCGPGGLIVVEADDFDGRLTISNRPALGLPDPVVTDSGTNLQGRFNGNTCPYQLEDGDWTITAGACHTIGTVTPPIQDCSSVRDCAVTKNVNGELWFSCQATSAAAACRSRLRAVP
jgi:hypothetical protein